MYIPFEELSDNSRIWIYQSERKFTEREMEFLTKNLEQFCNSWTVHSKELSASYSIPYSQFIILGINAESEQASGCSIDSSVRFILDVSSQLKADLTNRFGSLILDEKDLKHFAKEELETALQEGEINLDSIVFNNLITKKSELKDNWQIPLMNSWQAKVFKLKTTV